MSILIVAISVVTYEAFSIRVVHAGETHEGDASHAEQKETRHEMKRTQLVQMQGEL